MTEFLSGWDYESEEKHFNGLMQYQEYCGERFILEWSEIRDRIYEEAKLHQKQEVADPLLDYKVNQNKTNGCVSYGVSAAIEDSLCLAAQKRKEVEVFLSCAPWLYGGYHNMINGRPGSGGCSMSGMMQFIAQYGVLPYDTQPKIYADGEVDWNRNAASWKKVFAQFGEVAEQFQIKVAKLPRNFNDVVACLQAGYAVPYGTNKKLVLGKDGWYRLSGSTGHCMCWSGFGQLVSEHATQGFTFNKNSWMDGRGKLLLSDVYEQVNGRYFDAFVVLDVERTMKAKPDWRL